MCFDGVEQRAKGRSPQRNGAAPQQDDGLAGGTEDMGCCRMVDAGYGMRVEGRLYLCKRNG